MARGIFVSYRRDDTAHIAGRIHDALVAAFGRKPIFMDVDSVAPGEDFVAKIKDTIDKSGIFLAIIGPNWLSAAAPDGRRRIDLETDFIRLEVGTALSRGLKIIPVLVDGATMPRAEDLPPEISALVTRNAVTLNHTTFRRDMDALSSQLSSPLLRSEWMNPRILAGAAAALALIALAAAFWPSPQSLQITPRGLATTLSIAHQYPDMPNNSLTHVTYKSERSADGKLAILTDFPYLDRFREDGIISGIEFDGAPFSYELPFLQVQVSNQTETPQTLTELQFHIATATPNMTAIPVLREDKFDFHLIKVLNEGWGEMQPVGMTVTGWGLPVYGDNRGETLWHRRTPFRDPCEHMQSPVPQDGLAMAAFPDRNGTFLFDLAGHVPFDADAGLYVCAEGKLVYSDNGTRREVAFRSRVSNHHPNARVAAPNRGFFELYLDPDRDDYTAIIPVQQEIAPGEATTIGVSVMSRQSSDFELSYSALTGENTVIAGAPFSLQFTLPRHGDIGWSFKNPRYIDLPRAFAASIADHTIVEKVSYDEYRYSETRITLSTPLDYDACAALAEKAAPLIHARLPESPPFLSVVLADGTYMCSR